MRSLFLLAALASTSALAQGVDPALQLRQSFTASYVSRALQHGESSAQAAAEASCLFDHLAQYQSVAQWIDNAERSHDGRPLQMNLTPEQTSALQACTQPSG